MSPSAPHEIFGVWDGPPDERGELVGSATLLGTTSVLTHRSVTQDREAARLVLTHPGDERRITVHEIAILETDFAILHTRDELVEMPSLPILGRALQLDERLDLVGLSPSGAGHTEFVRIAASVRGIDAKGNVYLLQPDLPPLPAMTGGAALLHDVLAGIVDTVSTKGAVLVRPVPWSVFALREIGRTRGAANGVRGTKPFAHVAAHREPIRTKRSTEYREHRLARISRLPWLAHAYLPDYLRERLLTGLPEAERRRIRDTWAGLLDRLTKHSGPGTVELPIATPKSRDLKEILRTLWRSRAAPGGIDDPIFANILHGGKLGLLDFRLPRAIARMLPAGRWQFDLRPLATGALLAALVSSALSAGWARWGQQALKTAWHENRMAEHVGWNVTIETSATTAALGAALQKALVDARFDAHTSAAPTTTSTENGNEISYPPGQTAIAQRVANTLRHLSYGSPVRLVEAANTGTARHLQVRVVSSYHHTAAFSDAPLRAASDGSPKPDTKPGLPPIEPDMVTIRSGAFLMGSPPNELGRYDDEGPQHTVRIAEPFDIARYEVSFDEYDRFADATGRDSPNDTGWGRGKRPVINVSWQDARDYVDWLSRQTGRRYRLPTEAEWEYAARAGTTTPYWWGNAIGRNKAACDGCGSPWDNKQTAPVGSFKANPYGLYDTAGNVWEWTEDCWHGNYVGAPSDGRAWLESAEACNERVVRGGSWVGEPRYLRSASRYGGATDVAGDGQGFRIARAR